GPYIARAVSVESPRRVVSAGIRSFARQASGAPGPRERGRHGFVLAAGKTALQDCPGSSYIQLVENTGSRLSGEQARKRVGTRLAPGGHWGHRPWRPGRGVGAESDEGPRRFTEERWILARLQHPYICTPPRRRKHAISPGRLRQVRPILPDPADAGL